MKRTRPFNLFVSSRQAAPSEKRFNGGFLLIVLLFSAVAYTALALAVVHHISIPIDSGATVVSSSLNSLLVYFELPSFGATVEQWKVEAPAVASNQIKAIVVSLTVSFALTALTIYILRKKIFDDSLIHVKGGELLENKTATKRLTKLFKDEYKFSGVGLAIHPKLSIPSQRENQNALIVGAVGSGKTQFILPIAKQVIESESAKSIIFDYKGDYTEHFLTKPSVGLLAPWDDRTLEWNIREDVRNHNDALLFAQAIIPEPSGNADPMWTQGSRAILTGCVMAAITAKPNSWNWKTLSRILSLDITKLSELMQKYYPRAAHLLEKGSKTSSSFFQTLQTYCQPIFNLADYYREDERQFSIRSWLRSENGHFRHIILQHNTEMAPTAKANAELFLYFATRYLLSDPDDTNRQVYFILDESAHLNFKDLPELVSTGRSKGARVFLGVQDLGLFSKQFSDAEINALASMIGLTVSFRLSSLSKFTKQVSEGLGRQVIERLNTTTSSKGEVSQSWQQQELPIVSESDLMGLPQAGKKGVVGYLSFAGTNVVARLNWPITSLPKMADPTQRKKTKKHKPKANVAIPKKSRVSDAYKELFTAVNKRGNDA